MPIPRFLQNRYTNGRVREDHAPKSVYFKTCHYEGETREFQIVSTDSRSGRSVYRCVICGFRVEVDPAVDQPAQAESKKKE